MALRLQDARWPLRDRQGFVMVMVVLLLFAVALAGATGYQLVRAEADLTSGGEEAQKALATARAGLERYVGEHVGEPGDTASYLIGDGTVTVTQRRLVEMDDSIELYVLEAIGEVADPRFPGSPARRTVRQHARLVLLPVNPIAALISNATQVVFDDDSESEAGGSCGYGPSVRGLANPGTYSENGGDLDDGHIQLADFQALLDSIEVRWSVLTDPDFTIPDYDDVWPIFSGGGKIPNDSFPVIRVNGDFVGDSSRDGRGTLIVTGDFTVAPNFDWRGVILAGQSTVLDAGGNEAEIDGMLVTGLNGQAQAQLRLEEIEIDFRCNRVEDASRAIAYFALIEGTRWEF